MLLTRLNKPSSNLAGLRMQGQRYGGYTGIMENTMETTIVYWGYLRIMEKKMETTIVYWGWTCLRLRQSKAPSTNPHSVMEKCCRCA